MLCEANMSYPLQHIKAGEGVICSVQSADRDEEKWPEPNKFDIHRNASPKDVLGFGYGPHRCQGEWYSRQQLEIVFGRHLRRVFSWSSGLTLSSYAFPETA